MANGFGLCLILVVILSESSRGERDKVVTSIIGTTTLPTTTKPSTTHVKRVHTGSFTTSRKQKRRPSPIKRNRHLKKISKKSLRTTENPLLILARGLNYTVTGRVEINDYPEINEHVELFVGGGFRIYILDDNLKSFVFLGNLNRPYYDVPLTLSPINVNVKHISEYLPDCDMMGVVSESVDGKWIYENRTVSLKEGDVVNYRLLVSYVDGSYRVKIHQYFTIRKVKRTLVPEIPYKEQKDKYYVDVF